MPVPTSIPADGSVKAVWVPVVAGAAPTGAEIAAAGSFDLTCYQTADGMNTPTDEQSITDERLCSRQTFEQPGRSTDGLEIGYVYQAQGSPTDNKAFTTLKRGTKGNVVIRWGADYEGPLVAGDRVDVYPVTCGVQRKQTPEANSVLKIMQKMFVTSTVLRDVVVAA